MPDGAASEPRSDATGASAVLIADGERPRAGAPDRPVTEVAVGVLIRPSDRAFLLTSRPVGKAYAGHWEFPGGKVEPGESVAQALCRELREELGLDVEPEAVELWRVMIVDYPHALVRLHFCKLRRWRGLLTMREGQTFAWERLPVSVAPVLAGTVPVLEWLADERH